MKSCAWALLLAFSAALADFSYAPGRLIYRAATPLEAVATLALPNGEPPDVLLLDLETTPGRTATGLTDACAPRLGQPERFRDLYLVTIRMPFCPDIRSATFGVTVRGKVEGQRTLAPAEGSAQEILLQRRVLNYAESRQYRSRPALAATGALAKAGTPDQGLAASAAAASVLPAHRVTLYTQNEGLHGLDYAALKAAGAPVSSWNPAHLRLWHQGAEVPLHVSGEADGQFNPGDALEFLAGPARGDKTYYSPYSREDCYVLTWDGGKPGLRAPEIPAPPLDRAERAPAAFQATWHAEDDREVLRAFSTAEDQVSDLGDRVQESPLGEFWFWERQGPTQDQMSVKFHVPYSPVLGGVGESQEKNLVVRVQMRGITNDIKADPDHHVRFLLNGKDISLVDGRPNDAVWEGQSSMTWVSVPLATGLLKAGVNELTVLKVNDLRTSEGKAVEVQDAYLNWIELAFTARFAAVGGMARFSNRFHDSLGLRTFEVTGFGADTLSLWDTRGRRLQGFTTRREVGGTTLVFSDTLTGTVDYVACESRKRFQPRAVLDTLPDLLNPAQGADWIAITAAPLFGKGLDSLVAQRKAQDLRTAVVQAKHIYQAFGDGTTHPEALRRFVQYAYAHWPRPAPTYLLLIGETSLYFDKLQVTERPNWVPTHLIDIRGWGVAANDDYFGKVTGADEVPDLMVGRLPVADKAALSQVVAKIMRLENERDAGAWANQALFIGGYEAAFSAGNARFQARSLGLGRHTDRIDLFPSSPYYRKPAERRDFYRQLDSGLALVQFFGHGGGSVWSDAGLLTLQALDQDSLRGDWATPLVSSITCLTGYFEDPLERSLGEELVRRPRNGAAAFYGASGYISAAAGVVLGDALASVALRGGKTTVGGLVHEAEWLVRQKTGSAFLPILAEFNLLGDPAMPYRMPRVREDLQVTPTFAGPMAALASSESPSAASSWRLKAQGEAQAVKGGKARWQVSLLDSVWGTRNAAMSGATFADSISLAPSPLPGLGQAVVHVFADTVSEVMRGHFSTADWWVDSLSLRPAQPGYGDSVHLRIVLRTPYEAATFENGLALFALGGPPEPGLGGSTPVFGATEQRLLRSDDGRHLETLSPFVIPTPEPGGAALPSLYVKLRLGLRVKGQGGEVALSIDETTPHAFALQPRPRLSLRPQALTLPLQQEVGLYAHYQNVGPGEARNTKVTVTVRLPDTTWSFTRTAAGPLGFGQADSLFIALPDSALLYPLHLDLTPQHPSDAVAQALAADTTLGLATRILKPGDPEWVIDTVALRLRAPASNEQPVRVFLKAEALPALPAHLQEPSPVNAASEKKTSLAGYRILSAPAPAPGRRIELGDSASSSSPKAAVGWHARLDGSSQWLRLDTTASARFEMAGAGLYARLENLDREKPFATFQSRGQTLWPDDFVPRHTPIDIVLQDGQGLDLMRHPPLLSSRKQAVDSQQVARDLTSGTPTLARLRFTPGPSSTGRDTLDLTVTDVSGNVLKTQFAYRLGEALAIRNLGSYPNPFADTAIIAYTLTDYCESVSLRIYSRAGRLVRTLSDHGAVGYREVIWDGRTDAGQAIANGLYFLKVTARSGDRTQSSLFKLFKKRRR